MKRHHLPVQVADALAIGLALFLTIPRVHAETREAERGEPLPFSRLDVSLRVSPARPTVGQPIAVYAELTNRSDHPVRAHRAFAWFQRAGAVAACSNLLLLEISRGRSQRHWHAWGLPLREQAVLPSLIDPNERLRTKAVLVCAPRDGQELAEAGDVELRAAFLEVGGAGCVKSDKVVVAVHAAAGADADAFVWLRDRGLLPFLGYVQHLGTSFGEDRREALSDFVQRFPMTVYSPYARFALAQRCFSRKEVPQALSLLQRMEADPGVPTSLREDVLYLLGECYWLSQEPASAEPHLRRLVHQYPHAPAADDARARLVEVARHPKMLFAGDVRLDARISYEALQPTPLSEALQGVSTLGGVPLSAAPGLAGRKIATGPLTTSVREFMAIVSHGNAEWVPHGKGYRLVPQRD